MRRADKTYRSYVQIVMKSENLNFLEHSGSVQPCTGIALPLPDMDSFGSDSTTAILRKKR